MCDLISEFRESPRYMEFRDPSPPMASLWSSTKASAGTDPIVFSHRPTRASSYRTETRLYSNKQLLYGIGAWTNSASPQRSVYLTMAHPTNNTTNNFGQSSTRALGFNPTCANSHGLAPMERFHAECHSDQPFNGRGDWRDRKTRVLSPCRCHIS